MGGFVVSVFCDIVSLSSVVRLKMYTFELCQSERVQEQAHRIEAQGFFVNVSCAYRFKSFRMFTSADDSRLGRVFPFRFGSPSNRQLSRMVTLRVRVCASGDIKLRVTIAAILVIVSFLGLVLPVVGQCFRHGGL